MLPVGLRDTELSTKEQLCQSQKISLISSLVLLNVNILKSNEKALYAHSKCKFLNQRKREGLDLCTLMFAMWLNKQNKCFLKG